ncbi:glycoside hydrolase family 9 protein [Actinomadura scrupuli]|uniref:glycoside hydrolase family 9 protein n=1 Tax=Actinomadura scrupuli TaxID=559629 RepID=UPI003D99BEA2
MRAALPVPRSAATATAAACLFLALAGPSAPALSATAAGRAPGDQVRVDQVGYAAAERKLAYLMTSGAGRARFTVVDRAGHPVLTGRAGADRGAWNTRYPHVRALDLSALRRPGEYRVVVGGVSSPPFQVSSARLFGAPAGDAAGFFGTQRDGAHVLPGELRRRPAHLNDRSAQIYDWPVFTGPDTDETTGELTEAGGRVDVEGGWFDAGDFLKFTHSTAFATTLLEAAGRDGNRAAGTEARHGLAWLDKMWDGRTKTLYLQVGIGSGNAEGTYVGDHDLWRLPERDDTDPAPGHRFIRHRPVFRAAAPGAKISPNLAGRVTAAFALAAQTEPDPARARARLRTAAEVYAQARTTGVGQLVTALPHDFYPESVWHDDMELGGAELALAAIRLHDPRAAGWLRQSADWARRYIGHDGGDTFNLYDTSALAHADLIRAMRAMHAAPVPESLPAGDLRAQLALGAGRAAADPFGAGTVYDDFDAVPHAFGLAATARLYRQVSGDRTYDAFGTGQRDWVFGANAWGVSFMIGQGRTFERCPQHVVANLNGRLDGRRPVLTGAVVNGPNDSGLFDEGLGDHSEGMRPCPPDGADRYAVFTGHGSRYVDDVRSWQTSEPALDFTALGAYALTLASR